MKALLRRPVIAAISVAVALVFVLLAVLFAPQTPTHVLRPDEAAPVAAAPTYRYLLKEYYGMVAVFPAGTEQPSHITRTHVLTLPQADQELLRAGIPLYSEEELSARLQDYDS